MQGGDHENDSLKPSTPDGDRSEQAKILGASLEREAHMDPDQDQAVVWTGGKMEHDI